VDVFLMVVWVGVREGVCGWVLWGQRKAFFALRDDVARVHREASKQAGHGATILVADSSFVLPLHFYTEREVRRHLAFPIDFVAIDRLEKDDSGEHNLWGGRDGVFGLRIPEMKDVWFDPATCEVFWFTVPWKRETLPGNCREVEVLIGRPDGWLADALKDRGFQLSMTGDTTDWERVGGVFTPMAHEDTRIFLATKASE
jgi:hypothetical protein